MVLTSTASSDPAPQRPSLEGVADAFETCRAFWLSVRALIDLGFQEEAHAFRRWLRERKETLDHLEGYLGSRPVRAGNAAADQLQLDIYGEALDALIVGGDIGAIRGWKALSDVLDWLADNWEQPDEGI